MYFIRRILIMSSEPTKIVTGKIRLSYVHLAAPHAVQPGNTPKYSASILIEKRDALTLQKVEQAIAAAIQVGITKKWGGKRPGKLQLPLHDGDTERPEDPAYANCMYLNAYALKQPGIVGPSLQRILDLSEVYSGCYARVNLSFYPYNRPGNGIAVGLENVQKLAEGPALGAASTPPEEVFDVVADEGSPIAPSQNFSWM